MPLRRDTRGKRLKSFQIDHRETNGGHPRRSVARRWPSTADTRSPTTHRKFLKHLKNSPLPVYKDSAQIIFKKAIDYARKGFSRSRAIIPARDGRDGVEACHVLSHQSDSTNKAGLMRS